MEQYLVIGSNNFWYSIADTLQEAKQTAKEIKKKNPYMVFADPETGNEPTAPETVYIYKANLIKEL
jgi:hypothetical protein